MNFNKVFIPDISWYCAFPDAGIDKDILFENSNMLDECFSSYSFDEVKDFSFSDLLDKAYDQYSGMYVFACKDDDSTYCVELFINDIFNGNQDFSLVEIMEAIISNDFSFYPEDFQPFLIDFLVRYCGYSYMEEESKLVKTIKFSQFLSFILEINAAILILEVVL